MKLGYKTCHTCLGEGIIKSHQLSIPLATKKKAFELRKQGLTYRAIAKKLGFKHAQSIVSAIKSYMRIN